MNGAEVTTQALENKPLTKTGKSARNSKENFLSISCPTDDVFDDDLKLIIERWSELSLDTRRIIAKIVES